MKTTFRAIAAILVVASLVLITSCKRQQPSAGGGSGAGAGSGGGKGGGTGHKEQWVIGMSQCNLGEPWRVQMNEDIKKAAAEHPRIKLILKDAQNKSEAQQAQTKEFISQGVDLIIISPKEARPLTQPVADAIDKGIPVIVLDRKVEGDKYTCFIGADNVKIGREAGKHLVKLLGGKGNVVELKGLMTSTPGQERHNGFMEGLAGSELKIVFDADCQWLEPNASKEMNSALSRLEKIDAVYAHNDPSAHGAFLAAKQEGKGREKTIKFIGIDALPHEGVRYVKEGIMTATFQYPTGGKEAIDVAMKILKGEKVEKNITLGTMIYTAENVEKGGETIQ
ncbi:MAG TPA: substrate-binding domain-containing protein [Candidatus Brocadiia bacterium]|nr:substrate-binding domain-containing protein [Candidatus Brocadiia bacterium]